MIDLELGNDHGPTRYRARYSNSESERVKIWVMSSSSKQTFPIDDLRAEPGKKVKLSSIDTNGTPGWDSDERAAAEVRTLELNSQLEHLQEVMWAQGTQRLLVVLQAMDAGGKDGTIRHVFDKVNPTGVRVASFKKPSEAELSRDYLWRIHAEVPANGEIVIFNRSHYEDVLVVRVLDLVPKERWKQRYDHIRAFEKLLVDEGTTVVKIMLHISKDEQRERLQDRLDKPHKHWKFDVGDLAMRERWDDFMEAFEDAVNETTTKEAPWYVIPADRKWYRNLAISEIMVQTMESMGLDYPASEDLSGITIPE